jgi:four helix bundle protein
MDRYDEWTRTLPDAIIRDPLGRVQAYRLALFAGDSAWQDVTELARDRPTASLADQLYRAIGSISANIAEGYSRGTGRDRVRFLEYALGSARESRDWYYKARHILGENKALARLDDLSHIIRLLLVMVPNQRNGAIFESSIMYDAVGE